MRNLARVFQDTEIFLLYAEPEVQRLNTELTLHLHKGICRNHFAKHDATKKLIEYRLQKCITARLSFSLTQRCNKQTNQSRVLSPRTLALSTKDSKAGIGQSIVSATPTMLVLRACNTDNDDRNLHSTHLGYYICTPSEIQTIHDQICCKQDLADETNPGDTIFCFG